jgi:hypothetical protein
VCRVECREVARRNGMMLDEALSAGKNATLMLLVEGLTNAVGRSSGGFYRLNDWLYLRQYINAVKQTPFLGILSHHSSVSLQLVVHRHHHMMAGTVFRSWVFLLFSFVGGGLPSSFLFLSL